MENGEVFALIHLPICQLASHEKNPIEQTTSVSPRTTKRWPAYAAWFARRIVNAERVQHLRISRENRATWQIGEQKLVDGAYQPAEGPAVAWGNTGYPFILSPRTVRQVGNRTSL